MRKKTLLVGAFSPCRGPWVPFESGEWKVDDAPKGTNIDIWVRVSAGEYVLDGSLFVIGPGMIRAHLIEGKNVSLALTQIARA